MANTASSDFVERFQTSSDGLRLYWRDYPDPSRAGVTAVCLHGLTRNSRDFEELAPRLARSRRVLALDVRGRGRSDRDPDTSRYNAATYAGDVLELLDSAGIARVALIGTSMGGIIALLIAGMRPAALAGVVLNDIGPEIDPVGIARIASFVGRTPSVSTWDDAAEAVRALNGPFFPEFVHADWLRFAHRTFRESDGTILPDYDPAIGEGTRSGAAVPVALWEFWQALAAIPTLVIRGEQSDILSEATVAEMAKRKPDLEILRVADRGHAPTLDEPVCVAAIERFLLRI